MSHFCRRWRPVGQSGRKRLDYQLFYEVVASPREVAAFFPDNDLDRQTPLSARIDIKGISGAVANLPEPEDDDDGEFDWSDDETIVCYEQPKSKVYFNPQGQVVIRQQAAGYRDEDSFVFFNRENIPALIAALRGCIHEDAAPATTSAKDRTAAERQRRYRQRRNGGVTS